MKVISTAPLLLSVSAALRHALLFSTLSLCRFQVQAGNAIPSHNGADEDYEIDEEDDYDGIIPQSAEESRAEDIDIIAAENGWDREETESYMALQDAFKGLVGKLRDDDRFCESVMAREPGDSPKILFKGGIPNNLDPEIESFEDANNINVERVATKFSRADQQNRLNRMKDRLRAQGFGDITAAIVGDEIKISAQKPVDNDNIQTTPLDRGDIPAGQVDEVAANIFGLRQDDEELIGLQLDIHAADAQLGEFQHTRGGRRIYNGANGAQCTTSFAVRQRSTGETGILSAGHCGAGMNMYDAESSGLYNSPEADYSITHMRTDMGWYGDFIWYTTPHWELPQYWASPSSLRRVDGWDYYPSVNEQVCVYSRMQGQRSCTRVYSVAVNVDYNCCPPMNNLVATERDVTIPGDSGGPWSWNTIAYGVTSGGMVMGGVWRSLYSKMYWLHNGALGDEVELLCQGTCQLTF